MFVSVLRRIAAVRSRSATDRLAADIISVATPLRLIEMTEDVDGSGSGQLFSTSEKSSLHKVSLSPSSSLKSSSSFWSSWSSSSSVLRINGAVTLGSGD